MTLGGCSLATCKLPSLCPGASPATDAHHFLPRAGLQAWTRPCSRVCAGLHGLASLERGTCSKGSPTPLFGLPDWMRTALEATLTQSWGCLQRRQAPSRRPVPNLGCRSTLPHPLPHWLWEGSRPCWDLAAVGHVGVNPPAATLGCNQSCPQNQELGLSGHSSAQRGCFPTCVAPCPALSWWRI